MSTPPSPNTKQKQHPFITQTLISKSLGCLIGSALGDAIGLYTEFLPKTACHSTYPTRKFSLLPGNITKFRDDSHRDKFEPGDWTDDTDQSLLILLSYLHSSLKSDQQREINGQGVGQDAAIKEKSGGRALVVEPQDIALRIHNWITQGLRPLNRPPLGIGQTIGRVVLDPEYLSDPAGTALKIWIKSKRNAAPNGSLMRTHPLGILSVNLSEDQAFEVAAQVGRVTHVDPRCVVSCCLQVALVRGILRGEIENEEDLNRLIERAWEWVNSNNLHSNPEFVEKEEAEGEWETIEGYTKAEPKSSSILERNEFHRHCYAETLEELQLDDGQKMGYVYKCLASAILCLRKAMRREQESVLPLGSDLFEDLITELIMEGGDADTNACVAGALLGAWVGYSRLPPHWEKGIHNREWLLRKCQFVLYRVGFLDDTDGKWKFLVESDRDTPLDGGKGLLSKEDLDRRERDFVMMILLKQKERREEMERQEREMEKAKKSGIAKWFNK